MAIFAFFVGCAVGLVVAIFGGSTLAKWAIREEKLDPFRNKLL